MPPKSERFELRIEEDLLRQIDEWRLDQADGISRADAVRTLVGQALSSLSSKRRGSVALSDGERILIAMISDIMKANEINQNFDPDKILSALYGGHSWSLRWQNEWLLNSKEDDYEQVLHVVDTLDMWSFIENAYAKLNAKEKAELVAQAPYRGKNPKFPGYDGNEESRYMGIAQHLIHELGRFTNFAKHELNSHRRSVGRYTAMLSIFGPMRARVGEGKRIGVEELSALLNMDD